MQLSLSFLVLLGSLLALSSVPDPADAHPLTRAQTGRITLPLKRVAKRGDVHPELYLQQQINRAHRRYARMTGREVPSDEVLVRALQKRVSSLEARGIRLGRPAAGITTVTTVAEVNEAAAIPSLSGVLGAIFGGGNKAPAPAAAAPAKGKKKGGAAAAGAGAGAAAGAAAGAGAGAATGAGAGAATGAGAANATGTSAGFSQIDLQAAENGGLTAANTPTTGNSLGLDIEANDVGYVATVQIGTPPQDFKILMDSGSADFWVGGENCQSDQGGDCGNHTFLGTTSSSSFVDTGNPFQVTYGSGAVSGDIITDDVSIAGLALKAHTMGVATTESVQFSSDDTAFDGLMGLAQSTLSEQQTLTPVESLAQNGLIQDAITSYKISRVADQKNDGEITFGALDTTKFDQATLTTLNNVNTDGFWEADVDSFSVDGQDLGLTGRTAILDTGTTLIVAPPADAAAVMAAIPGSASDGQGGFTVPCTTNASVALTFGGQSFAIDPRDIAFLPETNDLTGDCQSGISAGQIGGANEWLVGDVFLKNAYFSTDVTKNQLSLAKLV